MQTPGRLALGVALALQLSATAALADSPSPRPSPSPPPAPLPAPAPSASPAPSAVPGVVSFSADEYAQAQAVVAATSLLTRIEAEQKLASAQRAFLDGRRAQLAREQADIAAKIATLQAQAEDKQRALERILQQEYRQSRRTPLEVLLATGSILDALVAANAFGALADAEHQAVVDLGRVQRELAAQRDELAAHQADLQSLGESLDAKDRTLAVLGSQAQRLSGGGSTAEIAVLHDLVDQQLAANAKLDQLIAEAAAAVGAPALQQAGGWVWPLKGAVSQDFGPTALALEPPLSYNGIPYPHFHAGIDIAAPLGTAVFAARAGRVAFVGHLPDGAEVVLIAHDGGLFTLYAHLDDVHSPPPVKVGQIIKAGDPLGVIGMTGITTGPHLHFQIRTGDEPLDPRSLLPGS